MANIDSSPDLLHYTRLELPNKPPELRVGESLLDERYQLLGSIPTDAYSEVYRATDWKGSSDVALKIFHEHTKQVSLRVDREIAAHQLLNGHPGVVPLRDSGTLELRGKSHRYVATEFAVGGTLLEHMQSDSVSLDSLIGMASEIIPGLASLHDAGFVHRDVKPSNILYGDGWEVTDFGIAEPVTGVKQSDARQNKIGSLAVHLTKPPADRVFGATGYIAPENFIAGEAVGPAADVFSMGVTLFYAATGQRPFRSDSFEEYRMAVITESPASARACKTAVPARLDKLLDWCLQSNPDDRPTTGELFTELQSV